MQLITVLGHAPEIAEGAWVAPGAVVAGRVRIGTETGVWYTAVVRADMESVTVGRGTSVQDGTVVHADPGFPCSIGDDVTVGHRAVVHGCTVEDECLIGMGAVVMNGATVGRGSVVAAGAVISQGVTVPPGSLVAGVPGKVRREVTDDERAMIAASAATYRYLLGVHRDATA
ncbi:carbonic anhydrase/acetyltransferase-like protein (isoleucine patch superfamily) [Actinomycetospora succinea]|uniref:Carbonic anhydrase/acetyltransferase-like protein (Isoleucine patch superfamily) n=1 Tax=Actinomycetospora succinea TaxID=663603 RepID=A0A4R6V1U1_9PSEU|nr:gamma carbonic anhydrase family protein [Actinomycetospora succinea]TDQ53960.1 carbonic anhydrase/acetyltransferase-like protein (isoleucine patch superfamily) [Actinomycetospora succinea]